MKIINQSRLGKTLKINLIISFIISLQGILASPLLFNHTSKTIYSMFIIYPNGILMLAIIFQFIKLFKSLANNNPFTFDNVNILKRQL